MPPPISLSEIIFPEQANHNFSKILGDLKRSNLSITNRLKSVRYDAAFVDQVAEGLALPLVANERCGSWYIDPNRKAGSAYFKSTDGHTGQWKFSTRRLNLHMLELIGQYDGCIIVDSTRRGKRMPDALSKTVPVWCCVLNRILFPNDSHELFVPPNVVSDNEKSQMEGRIPEFIASFLALDINLPPLRKRLRKPLRPMWITQDDPLVGTITKEISRSFHPVICCTSSKRVIGAEMSEAGYIQGAGDDTENWALGLTAPLFWKHADELLSTDESDLPERIQSLVNGAVNPTGEASASSFESKQVAPYLFVAPISAGKPLSDEEGTSCVITFIPETTEPTAWVKSRTFMEVGLGKSKTASRMLRGALPQICEFASRFLGEGTESESERKKRITLLCETGKDLSVGVALCLYCWCFDGIGRIRGMATQRELFTKNAIRVKLGQIMMAQSDLNPSRATLQSVNSFLMDWRK